MSEQNLDHLEITPEKVKGFPGYFTAEAKARMDAKMARAELAQPRFDEAVKKIEAIIEEYGLVLDAFDAEVYAVLPDEDGSELLSRRLGAEY